MNMPRPKNAEELIDVVMSMRNYLATLGPAERFGQLPDAVSALTGGLREIRQQHEAGLVARPSGSDRDAYDRYTAPATSVSGRVALRNGEAFSGPVQYAAPDTGLGAREYAASKTSDRAVRFLSEYDEDGGVEPGLLDDPAPVTAWQARLQEIVTIRSLVRTGRSYVTGRGVVQLGQSPKMDRILERHLRRGPDWVRHAVADNANEGAELIPDVTLPELMRKLTGMRNVTALFQSMSLPNNGNAINPYLTRGLQPFIVGQPVAGDLDPANIQRSQPYLESIQAAPKTWGVSLPSNRDAEEDSLIAYAPMAVQWLLEALRDGREDAWINADGAVVHGDTGLANWNPRARWPTLGHAGDHRKSFIGLRHHSIDVASNGALAAESALGVLSEFTHLDSPHFLGRLVIITSPEWYILNLLTDTNLLTIDKIGTLATLLTGQVGAIGGHPVVVSEFVDKAYNASGIYDHATVNKTGVLIVNRDRWANGERRGPRVETEVRPSQHTTVMTVTDRWVGRHLGASTEKSVSWQYNASTS